MVAQPLAPAHRGCGSDHRAQRVRRALCLGPAAFRRRRPDHEQRLRTGPHHGRQSASRRLSRRRAGGRLPAGEEGRPARADRGCSVPRKGAARRSQHCGTDGDAGEQRAKPAFRPGTARLAGRGGRQRPRRAAEGTGRHGQDRRTGRRRLGLPARARPGPRRLATDAGRCAAGAGPASHRAGKRQFGHGRARRARSAVRGGARLRRVSPNSNCPAPRSVPRERVG